MTSTPNVNDALKKILACPKCKTQDQIEWKADEIRCHRCRLVYRIEEGIPVMLIDQAKTF